tara:strand:+ start:4533 stop:5057 length:525 start_codon:yes stop_codon:yes gene_type:complete
MKHYKQVKATEVSAITCDKCASSFQVDTTEFQEFYSFEKRCGFGSIFGGGSTVSVDFCQRCFHQIAGQFIHGIDVVRPSWTSFFEDKNGVTDDFQDVIDKENQSIAELLGQMDRDTMLSPVDHDTVPNKVKVTTNLLHELTVAIPSDVISNLGLEKGDDVEFRIGNATITLAKV